MNPFKASMAQASAGMRIQSNRIGLGAENISNADTPGYRRKILVPEPQGNTGDLFRATRTALDPTPGQVTFEPGHPLADADGYVVNSNVSIVSEMADLREANRSYEANLNSYQQARQMYRSLLDILKR